MSVAPYCLASVTVLGREPNGDDAPSAPQRRPGHSHQPHRPDADHHDHLAELDLHPFHAREARGDHVVDHHGLNARDGIRDLGKIEVSIERLDQRGERAAIRRVVREVPAVALVILGFTLAALAGVASPRRRRAGRRDRLA